MADKAKERRRGGRVTVLRRRIFLIAVLTMAMLFGFAVGINLYILHLNEDVINLQFLCAMLKNKARISFLFSKHIKMDCARFCIP